MDDFQLLRPLWLLTLIPLAVWFVLLRKKNPAENFWKDKIDDHLLPHVLVPIENHSGFKHPGIAYAFALTVIILALSGPSWDKSQPLLLKPEIPPLVIIFDLSASMTVQDIQPSRLVAAQTKLHSLLGSLPPRPMALIAFSTQAHSVMPFTEDRRLIIELLPYLTPELMPSTGSHSASGLALGGELLQQNGYSPGDLLLITDQADSYTIAEAKAQAEKGFTTSVYAIATLAGGSLALEKNPGKDAVDEVHLSLEKASLAATASEGQGVYQEYTRSSEDLANLLNQLIKREKVKTETSAGPTKIPRDQGAWLVLLLLPFALYLFRPGWLLALCLSINLLPSPPAIAMDWSTIWYNAAQRGLQALENERPEQAEQLFTDPYLLGIAQYRQRNYTAALHNFKQLNTANAYYNQGNVLAHLGRFEEALAAYKTAYTMDHALKDAQKNAQIIQQIISQKTTSEKLQAELPGTESRQKKSDIKRQAALNAEDLLDAPDNQRTSQHAINDRTQHPPLAKVSGGATLHSDRKTGQVEESNAIGQTASEGLDDAHKRDQVVRQGKTAGAGQSAERQVMPNTLLEKQTNTETTLPRPSPQNEAVKTESAQANASLPAAHKATENADTEASSVPGENFQESVSSTTESHHVQGRQLAEKNQSLHHWLDSINDDPTDLLKEKFRREYKRGVSSSPAQVQYQQPW